MTLRYLFPTTIGIYQDDAIAETIIPYAKRYLADDSELTNTWGYKNTYKPVNGLETKEELQFLCDYIKGIGNLYLQENGFKSQKLIPHMFFSGMVGGDVHSKHTHPNSVLSGVLYLDVPEGSGKIRFHEPNPLKKINKFDIENDSEPNWEWFELPPEKGMILVFPSWLEHEVLENKSQQDRMTLVFNLAYF